MVLCFRSRKSVSEVGQGFFVRLLLCSETTLRKDVSFPKVST